MSAKRLIKLIGTGVVMASVAGYAVAENHYGEAGAEWLAESPENNSAVSIESVADINELNKVASAASGKSNDNWDDEEFWVAE